MSGIATLFNWKNVKCRWVLCSCFRFYIVVGVTVDTSQINWHTKESKRFLCSQEKKLCGQEVSLFVFALHLSSAPIFQNSSFDSLSLLWRTLKPQVTSEQAASQPTTHPPPSKAPANLSVTGRPAARRAAPTGHNGGRIWERTVHQPDANRLTHLHNAPPWDGPED